MATAWSTVRTRMPELPIELLIAATFLTVTTVGVWTELRYADRHVAAPAGAYTFGFAASVILVARRRRPVLVSVVALLIVLAYHLAGYPGEAPGMVLFIAFYSVAAYGRGAGSLVQCGLLVLLALLVPTLPPHPQPWYSFAVLGPSFGMAWMVVLGAAAGRRRLAAEERVRRAEVTAQARLRERMADERLLIARELHDVLAHTISLIAVQSGLALDSLDDQPEATRTALLAVRSAARQAMPELRAALGLLRGDHPDTPGALAQPTLEQLAELATEARAAGLRVEVTQPPPDQIAASPLLQLTGYRIVQEALTNVVRHAHASAVEVSVRREERTLVIEVRDDGHGPDPHPGTGLGIAGMRERAQLVGGTVTAGPRPGGGFGVHARLPLETA